MHMNTPLSIVVYKYSSHSQKRDTTLSALCMDTTFSENKYDTLVHVYGYDSYSQKKEIEHSQIQLIDTKISKKRYSL